MRACSCVDRGAAAGTLRRELPLPRLTPHALTALLVAHRLQVAQKYMPVSSLIIGVDLVPIRSIPRVITHAEDITTTQCRSVLKKDMGNHKADVVLHDGAPNVGAAWIKDAYGQVCILTLPLCSRPTAVAPCGCVLANSRPPARLLVDVSPPLSPSSCSTP